MNARRHVIDVTCDAGQVEDSVSCLFHTILFHRSLGKFKFGEDAAGQPTILIGTVGYEDVDCTAVDLTCSVLGLKDFCMEMRSVLFVTCTQLDASFFVEDTMPLLGRYAGKMFRICYSKFGDAGVGGVHLDCICTALGPCKYVRCSSPELRDAVSRDISPFVSQLDPVHHVPSAVISLEFYEKRARGFPVMGHDKLPWEIWLLKFTLANFHTEFERQKRRYELAPVLADKMLMVVDAMNRYEYVPKNPRKEELGVVFDTSLSDVQPYLFRITNPAPAQPHSVSRSMGRFFREALEI